MLDNKILKDEELENVHGGTRPEEIGDPIILVNGIVSYKVCDKCGAAMFPVKIRSASGSMILPVHPDYQCSECDNRTTTLHVQ